MKACDLQTVNATNLDAYLEHLKEVAERIKKHSGLPVMRRVTNSQPDERPITGLPEHYSYTE